MAAKPKVKKPTRAEDVETIVCALVDGRNMNDQGIVEAVRRLRAHVHGVQTNEEEE